MHKYLVVFFIIFNGLVSFSQQTAISTRTLRVASATAVFNQNIPIGTLVLDLDKLYFVNTGVDGAESLGSALAIILYILLN